MAFAVSRSYHAFPVHPYDAIREKKAHIIFHILRVPATLSG